MFAIAGWITVKQSLAMTLKERPAQAHSLSPGDGQLTGRYALSLVDATPDPAELSRVAQLARLAIRQDATSVRGIAALGLVEQVRGHGDTARKLFAYAQSLSRRELQVQLWAIEDAVARDDIAGAVRSYDIALRTSRVAPDLLFPILGKALDDGAIRSALVKTLADRPVWAPSFFLYSSANGPEDGVFAFFGELARAGVDVTEEPRARLIARLWSRNAYDRAWALYLGEQQTARRDRSRDPTFSARSEIPTLFDWSPVNSVGISTTIEPGRPRGVVDFFAPSSVGGPALQQALLLPAGRYRLEGHSMSVEQPDSTLPYWSLACADGREIGRVPVTNSARNNGRFAGDFVVPANCPAQRLTLVIRASSSASGSGGQFDFVQLAPAPGPRGRS